MSYKYIIYLITSYFILYVLCFQLYYTYKDNKIIGDNKIVEKKFFKFPIIVYIFMFMINIVPILGFLINVGILVVYCTVTEDIWCYKEHFKLVIKNKLFKLF